MTRKRGQGARGGKDIKNSEKKNTRGELQTFDMGKTGGAMRQGKRDERDKGKKERKEEKKNFFLLHCVYWLRNGLFRV